MLKNCEVKLNNFDFSVSILKIVEEYTPLVRSRVALFLKSGIEYDDLMQEGMIGLFKAIKGYDYEKDVSFKSFADLCIRRQIITAIKASKRQKHIPLNSYLSLN